MIRIVVILAAFAVLEYHVSSRPQGFVESVAGALGNNPVSAAACNASNAINSGAGYVPGLGASTTAAPVQAGANRKKRDVKDFSSPNPHPAAASGSAPAGIVAAFSQITAPSNEN
jgi:hypothetical protein